MEFPPIDTAPPSVRPDVVDDLGKERELRRLRARVEELEKIGILRGDKIIPATCELEFEQRRHTASKCGFHPQVTVCMETPRVECKVCEEELDPVEVLRDFVREERKFVWTIEGLRREKEELTKVVEALKKERVNVRAQLRKQGIAGEAAQRIEDKARWSR